MSNQYPFPPEILIHIVSFCYHDCVACGPIKCLIFDSANEQADGTYRNRQPILLRTLSLVDRFTNSLVTPLLYRALIPTWGRCFRLLRTLHEKPKLGEHVRSIGLFVELVPGFPDFPYFVEDSRKEDENLFAVLAKDIQRRFEIGTKDPYIRGLAPDGPAELVNRLAICWMMLYFLPNLQNLIFTVNRCALIQKDLLKSWFSPEVGSKRVAQPIPSAFSSLRFISCTTAFSPRMKRQHRSCNNREFPYLMLLAPALQELIVERCYWEYGSMPFQPQNSTPPVPSLKLEVMRFRHCQFESSALLYLTSCTPALRVLDLSFCATQGRGLVRGGPLKKGYRGLLVTTGPALLHNGLEELSITFEHNHDSMMGPKMNYKYGWIGDLSNFDRLQSLTLDAEFWTLPREKAGQSSADFLPRKLKSLKIIDVFGGAEGSSNGVFYCGKYEQEADKDRVPTFRPDFMERRFQKRLQDYMAANHAILDQRSNVYRTDLES